MSLLSRVLERGGQQRRGIFDDPWSIPSPGSFGAYTKSGVTVDDSAALGVAAFFAGVRILADTVATTPLRAVSIDEHGVKNPLMTPPVQITNPFYDVNLSEGISQIMTSLILRGNAYGLVVARDPLTGLPTSVYILSPDAVRCDWARDAMGTYRKYVVGGQEIPGSEIMHIASFMLPGAATGAGVLEYCRNMLGLGIALDDTASSFFANGVMSTGVLSSDQTLPPDAARAIKDQFVANHSGTSRSYLPIVVGGGMKYTQLSLTPEDSQFIQSREFQNGLVATLLGVPPHLLGIVDKTTSWGSGIASQNQAFLEYALRPYYTRIATAITAWLPKDVYADFNTDATLRAEPGTRYANYNTALMAGFMNIDEVRALEGMPPLPNGQGQRYRVSTQLAPVSEEPAMNPTTPMVPIPPTDPQTGNPQDGNSN